MEYGLRLNYVGCKVQNLKMEDPVKLWLIALNNDQPINCNMCRYYRNEIIIIE